MDILNWLLIGASVPLIIVLVVRTKKRAKELDDRIRDYKAEQEAAKSKPGYSDPYMDFAQLMSESRKPKGRNR
ncbi:MAG: protein BatD [Armatimonadetes bacterium]|nr:protein BatD [Armatimonadota bacterium]